nr:reverse transcriptase domain-containing protein [Tanacetum cinerariifolium]
MKSRDFDKDLIDTFYNSLNQSEQDSLNSAANVSSASGSSTQDAHVTALTKKVEDLLSSFNQPVNSIQNRCETCGGPHPYYECQAASGYTQDVYATSRTYNQCGNAYQPQGGGTRTEEDPRSGTHREYQKSPTSALAHMPKFAKMVKDLLANKEKLLELSNTPLNENCTVVLLKKLPKKLRYTGRFLIPCDFYRLESCMSLADLGASINLMPLSVRKTLSLSELTPTRMTLLLATYTVAYLAGIAKDVFVQVGNFTFPADFVVVDYDVDPWVPFNHRETFLEDGTCSSRRDIRLIETLLNNHISNDLLPPLPVFEINENKKIKTSIDDPPHLKLKDLPPHLDYAFLEGTSKLPIIIANDLKREEKE